MGHDNWDVSLTFVSSLFSSFPSLHLAFPGGSDGKESDSSAGDPGSAPGLGRSREREPEVAQSCPTLCDPVDCSLPGSSVHGIFQKKLVSCSPWGCKELDTPEWLPLSLHSTWIFLCPRGGFWLAFSFLFPKPDLKSETPELNLVHVYVLLGSYGMF